MKHYQEVEETRKVKNIIKTTCDICGKEFTPETEEEDGTRYNSGTITHAKGFVYTAWEEYHDGRSHLELDICGDCFKNKIKPFLKSLGVDIQYKDSFGELTDDPDEDEPEKKP